MIANRAEVLTYLGKAASATEAEQALVNLIMPMAERALKDFLQYDPEYGQRVEYLPMRSRATQLDGLEQVDRIGNKAIFYYDNEYAPNNILQLKHLPVWLSGLEVREQTDARAGQASGSFGSDTILTAGTDYWLDVEESDSVGTRSLTGHLHRIGSWPYSPRSVKVTYYGGYNRADFDSGEGLEIKMAAILTAVKAFKQAKTVASSVSGAGLTSESIGHWSGSFDPTTVAALSGMSYSVPDEAKERLQTKKHYGRLFA